MFQFGPAKTFYTDYRDELEAAQNVDIITYATVVDIRVNDSGKAVTSVKIAAPGGKEVLEKVFRWKNAQSLVSGIEKNVIYS